MNFSAKPSSAAMFFQVHPEKTVPFRAQSAWFSQQDFESLDAQPVGDGVPWQGCGGRVRKDTTLPTVKHGSRILRAGGALLKKTDGVVLAIQPPLFINRFSRCYSNGTVIVSLSLNAHQQAVALAQAHTQLRNRVEDPMGLVFWKTLLKRKELAEQKANLDLWNAEIQAHIDELSAFTFSDKFPR